MKCLVGLAWLDFAWVCCRFGRCTFTRLQIALATLVRQSADGSFDQYAYRGAIITIHCPRSAEDNV